MLWFLLVWYGEVQAQLVMFWQWMCLLDVPLQRWYIYVCVRVRTHSISHLCLHNCSQCLRWGSWVSTDKSLAWLVPEILSLIQRMSEEEFPPSTEFHHMAPCVFSPQFYGGNIIRTSRSSYVSERHSAGVSSNRNTEKIPFKARAMPVRSLTLCLHKDASAGWMLGNIGLNTCFRVKTRALQHF